ncbi:homoserine O-acetyltransferase/O-succinyltransferase family protein [Lacticaseibacillus zhaodongensis]|uniref:homoserine O-acetyltransferase/O-succinyltransferase family protein n=1 Tax=Lacticaseibacillus zhaodongensis TaxID=2668065 RepID=UPI0012D3210C|nr:homoserine O-succinyltransferase [Lacticaseibacillus zhaodongensis]
MSSVHILNGLTAPVDSKPQRNARNILILNLMPNRAVTEQQFVQAFAATGIPVNLTFCLPATHHIRQHEAELRAKYRSFDQVRKQYFDALIVTGAPLDRVAFNTVDYWPELQDILAWRHDHTRGSLFICWGAYAAGKIDGIFTGKQIDRKITGVFTTDGYTMPQSRYFIIPQESVKRGSVIAGNSELGATIVTEPISHSTYVAGHFEYLTGTLADEYNRDRHKNGAKAPRPVNYFAADLRPRNSWQADAKRFYTEWLNAIPKQTRTNKEETINV